MQFSWENCSTPPGHGIPWTHYVAPTKALVNQIAAEVQARFSKNLKHPGRSVWGIHTRDYRINNPTGCQVLVTVPHILQIMLLAPSKNSGPDLRTRRAALINTPLCTSAAERHILHSTAQTQAGRTLAWFQHGCGKRRDWGYLK